MTPASLGVSTLSKADEPQTPEDKEEMLKFPYREAGGAFMWKATMTQPYIACAVRAVARFCQNPGLAHTNAVLKIMDICSKRRNGASHTVGKAVDSIWRRTRTRSLKLVWIPGGRYRVR